jgi:diacylglycerol kinase
VGPETLGAIRVFQQAHTRFVDERIDPGGPTLTALEKRVIPAIEAVARKQLLGVLDELDRQLARRGYRLPDALAAKLARLRERVSALPGGYSAQATRLVVTTPAFAIGGPHTAASVVLAAAPAVAAVPAAAAAAEAALIALLAAVALLVLLQSLPLMSRRLEELIRQIQILMAELLDMVNTAVEGIEDLIRRNPRAGMRCSEVVLRFRNLTQEVIEALTSPRPADPVSQQQQVIRTSNLMKKWQEALQELLNCLISSGAV